MLTKISEKLREFVSTKDQTLSRKRKFESDVSIGEGGPSPAKRTRQDTADQASAVNSQSSRFSQLTQWVTRTSATVSEHSLLKALSPQRLFNNIRDRMTSQPRQSTPYPYQQKPLPRHYMQPHSILPRPSPFNQPGDVREKTNLPQPKFNESVMSPGGHVAPPRAPRASGYGYQSQFDPTKQPQYSFGRPPGSSQNNYTFRAPPPVHQPSYGQSRNSSYSQSHAADVHRSMYNKLFGRRGRGIDRYRHKQAVKESIRIDEKKRYADLLRNYTQRFEVTEKRPVKVTDLSAADVQKSDKKVKHFHATPQRRPGPIIDLTKDGQTEKSKSEERPIDLTEDEYVEPRLDLKGDKGMDKKENETEVIDLSDDDEPKIEMSESIKSYPRSPTNESLKKNLMKSKYGTPDWIDDLKNKYSASRLEQEKIKHLEIQREIMKQKKQEWESELEQSLRRTLALSQREPPVIEEPFIEIIESEEEEEEEEEQKADEFPPLTGEEEDRVDQALIPRPAQQVLVEGFKLQLTRADITTLGGLNWLNDEVINFYMNMLMERGTKDNFPSVHAFNTFFYPKLMSNGHAGVKRWTKRGNIDIFAKDYVLIPVHLGMHWCLAAIDFTKKEIRYYDSMGGENNACLNALKQYLEDESMDKKKQAYRTEDWNLINVKSIPHQMNGSDCGMFTCKFAEYISRGAEITFSQEHMPYFRRRMILELLSKEFMT